ncbi:MAG TPA: SigE family RNA polymerase sigma factor [Streptosporangiaceae bacterium]
MTSSSQTSLRPEIAPRDEITGVPPPRRSERTLSDYAGNPQRVPAHASGTARPDGSSGASAGVSEPEFRDYVRTRRRALLRIAYLLTRNEADAEDLVQSALAKTYLAAGRIEDRSALDGYVRRAIVNTHISLWRRRRVVELPTDELPDEAVADHAVTSDLQATIRRAVDRLPGRMRAAIMLRYYDDMTEAEVAELLGVSLGTVKSTVARAVAKLRIDADLQSG